MKKFTYLSILLFTLTMVSCSDPNVLVPSVTSPDQNWMLEQKIDFFQALTTNPTTEAFTKTIENSNGESVLYVRNIITTDSKCEMRPTSMVTNNGKNIELIYRDESPIGTLSLGSQKNTEMRHYFVIRNMGKGTGANIPVTIKYVFPNPNLGVNRNEIKTLTF